VFLTEIIATSSFFETYDTIIFGLFTFSSKIGLGIGGLLLGVTLNIIDYEQGVALQNAGIFSLVFIMGAFPAVTSFFAMLFTFKAISRSSQGNLAVAK
jgi:Na+/melibiose symporter-like transporter